MKAYKVEMIVVDFGDYGSQALIEHLENSKYYAPDIVSITEVDLGEWTDEHPLNLGSTTVTEKRKYFE